MPTTDQIRRLGSEGYAVKTAESTAPACGWGVSIRVCDCTDMPWTADYYPNAMQHLSVLVREKAIEIANALLAEGEDEGKAIRIAIAKAKQWAHNRGIPASDADP